MNAVVAGVFYVANLNKHIFGLIINRSVVVIGRLKRFERGEKYEYTNDTKGI